MATDTGLLGMGGEETASGLLDEVLPESLDWRGLVSRYPRSSVLVAAVVGFALGRARGTDVLDGLGSFAVTQARDAVDSFFDR